MKVISSRSNAAFRSLLKLKESSRQRRAAGVALLDGPHLVSSYLERVGHPRMLVVAAGAIEVPEIDILRTAAAASETMVLSDQLFRAVSPVVSPTGILAAIDIRAGRPVPCDVSCCLLIEGVQDPGNLGSILRSAAAAGVGHVLQSAACADAWSPRVLRAAMGAHFSLNIVEGADLVGFAREFAGQVVAAVARAQRSIFQVDFRRATALLLGNEGSGLSDQLRAEADVLAAVPMSGGAESINVGAAAAVCLFERVRQLG